MKTWLEAGGRKRVAVVTPASDRALRFLSLIAEGAAHLLAARHAAGMVDDLFRLIQVELRLDVFFNYRLTEGGQLELEAHGGLTEDQARAGAVLRVGEAVCGCVARDRTPLHATSVQGSDDPMMQFIRQVGLDSYACTPLMQGDALLGTLGFGRRWAPQFDQDELNFLHTLCHYVALAKHRLKAEQELREAVAAQEALLQELNHRVRNSLQIVIGMLALEEGDAATSDSRAAIARARDRVLVIAAVHQRLYDKVPLDGVEITGLLRDLTAGIAAAGGPGTTLVGMHDICVMPVERAVSLALVVDELLRTSVPAEPHLATLTLSRTEEGRLRLRLEAQAALPLPDRGDPGAQQSRVIRALLHQLRATLTQPPAPETCCELELWPDDRTNTQ